MTGQTFMDRLPEQDRADILGRLNQVTFGPGEDIVEQDSEGSDVYFVLDGIARAELNSQKGKKVSYRDIGPGELFGEIAGIDGGRRSATVTAETAVRVGVLSRADFRALLVSHAAVNEALLQHLAEQSRQMTERIFRYAVLVIRERLIAELLRLSQPIANAENMAEIRPALRHQDIADWITCHREAVSREMSNLKKLGFIDYSDGAGAITLRNVSALETLLADTDS